ncbi:RND efflux system, outer membrane lipoprotein, NodT family [Desulfatibacillum aliphaticivorans]|uniref:RND efflux system, outer membrane lipoprotein, NodT family n=1 Tax=Desulfatibacillum aliphaticivorans TaxID=218208 RepID=B8FA47_DESAL|nr:efflux transporter outer membrane subunit [Desulfatibacillum aliphaticivorans]ACL03143.1 RND efflux system, outer membrane lipoprotein, NodT family [Desulfatibacillum aliphaticivorans]
MPAPVQFLKRSPESVTLSMRLGRTLVFALIFICFCGCIKAGPDYQSGSGAAVAPGLYVNQEPLRPEKSEKTPYTDSWWTGLNNPELNALVEEALANNPDIRAAAARVLEYRAVLAQARAGLFPSVSLSGEGSWSEATSTSSTPVLTSQGISYVRRERDVHSTSLDLTAAASYELDLWGRIARSNEAARADLLAVEENARTVAQTIAAETVSAYLEIENLRRRIAITQESIEDFKRNLSFIQRRYEGGIASVLDLRQARRLLAQAESLLPPLRRDMKAKAAALAVLAGKYPNLEFTRKIPKDYYKALPPVPPGLPSDLLLRRPDVRQAEAGLQAASARIGVARAARFPSISLTGALGTSSPDLEDLFSPENRFWNLAAGLLAPIYDAGELKAAEEAARARFAREEAAYAKTVLSAFAEVESALAAQKEQREYRELLLKLVEESAATRETAQSRYEQGLSTYLDVLDAQQALYSAQQTLINSELAIYLNRVTLYRALGGGWPASEKKPKGSESKQE